MFMFWDGQIPLFHIHLLISNSRFGSIHLLTSSYIYIMYYLFMWFSLAYCIIFTYIAIGCIWIQRVILQNYWISRGWWENGECWGLFDETRSIRETICGIDSGLLRKYPASCCWLFYTCRQLSYFRYLVIIPMFVNYDISNLSTKATYKYGSFGRRKFLVFAIYMVSRKVGHGWLDF